MSQWLQILHVSDLHFGHGTATTRFDQEIVVEGILRDAAALASELGPPDLIVVTGDIAFSANESKEYPQADAWLRLLAEKTNRSAHILVVPGNHDVNREKAREHPRNYVHLGLRNAPNDLDSFFERPAQMTDLWPKLDAYARFANAFGCGITPEQPFAVQTFPTPLGPVSVAMLNTTLMSFNNEDAPSNLRAGKAQILKAIHKAADGNLLLILQHHPTSWLLDGPELRAAAAQKPAFLFSGHIHDQNAGLTMSLLQDGVFQFDAGAGHGENEGEHAYAWVRLSTDELQYYPRSWSRRDAKFVASANSSAFRRSHDSIGEYSEIPRLQLPAKVRDWLTRGTPKTEAKKPSWRSFLPRAASRGRERRSKSHHQIPPAPVPYLAHPYPLESNFTGRSYERGLLTSWLRASNQPWFVFSAIGGMGKSALTWYWLRNDFLGTANNDFEGVIWWSFYETNAQFNTFVQHAVVYAAYDRIRETQDAFQRTRRLADILNQRRMLIVLDGYEREMVAYAGQSGAYQGDDLREAERKHVNASIDPNAASFFRWIAEVSPSKLLITSRLFPRELLGVDGQAISGCSSVNLSGLQPEDAVAFMRSQGVTIGSDEQIADACARYANHPLSLRLLSGLVRNDFEKPGDIAAAAEGVPIDDLVARQHHILQVSFDALGPRPRDLLGRIAVHRGPVPYQAIKTFAPNDADELLHILQDRGFISRDKVTQRFDLHPVVRNFAYDRLVDKGAAIESARNYYATIPVPDDSDVESIEQVSPLLELFHHTVLGGDVLEGFRLLRDRIMPIVYYRLGHAQRFLALLQHLWKTATNDAPPSFTSEVTLRYGVDFCSWTMNSLGVAYNRTGEPHRAVRFFEVLALQDEAYAFQYLGTTLTHLGETHAALGRLAAAKTTLERATHDVGLIDPRDVFVSLRARISLARLMLSLGDPRTAADVLRDVISRIEDSTVFSRDSGPNFDRNRFIGLARAALAQCLAEEDPAAAQREAEKAYEAAAQSSVELDLAQAEIVSAALASARGDHDDAVNLLNSALTRVGAGGAVNVEIRARLALATAYIAASGRAPSGETRRNLDEQFATAATLIDGGGYRLHMIELEILRARFERLLGRRDDALHRLRLAEHAASSQLELRYGAAISEIVRLRKEMS